MKLLLVRYGEKVISSIDNLHKKNFYNISMSMVFGEINSNLKEKFISLNNNLGTEPVGRIFIPKGRGDNNVLEFLYEKTNLPLSIPKSLSDRSIKSKKISSCSCNALREQLFIGLFLIICIEYIQYFIGISTDIDDIILNVLCIMIINERIKYTIDIT
ncbi:MAG: VanZ family protein [Romboutsia sp.]